MKDAGQEVDHGFLDIKPKNVRRLVMVPEEDFYAIVRALDACEENLRLLHEAAGPVPPWAPMPKHSTFRAWELARNALGKALAPTPESAVNTSLPAPEERE